MSDPHVQSGEVVAQPGEMIDVRPLGAALASVKTRTLVKSSQMEVIRLVVQAGKESSTHQASGEVVVQCLEGQVALTALGKTQHFQAGQLLYLPANESHSIQGIEDASLLLTLLLPNERPAQGGR